MADRLEQTCPDTGVSCMYLEACSAVAGRYHSRIANELTPHDRREYIDLLARVGIQVHTGTATDTELARFGRPCLRLLGEHYGLDPQVPSDVSWLAERANLLGHGVYALTESQGIGDVAVMPQRHAPAHEGRQ